MYLLINKRATSNEQCSMLAIVARCTLHVAQWMSVIALVFLSSCSQQKSSNPKSFYDIDSLISIQINSLKGYKLIKSVEIDGKKEQTTFNPDSLQWTHELDIFRSLDQFNKNAFRDAYVISDRRDANSNLMIREFKATRPVPVSFVKLYYLGTLNDLRKIEGMLTEENALYVNDRKMIMDFDHRHLVSSYRLNGSQKMVMSDSVNFVISGEVGM